MDGSVEKLLAQTYLELKALHAKLDQLLGEQPTATGWASPDEAAAALKPDGVRDARHLKRLRLEGAFSEARGEIRDISNGSRPVWQYHAPSAKPRCSAILSVGMGKSSDYFAVDS